MIIDSTQIAVVLEIIRADSAYENEHTPALPRGSRLAAGVD